MMVTRVGCWRYGKLVLKTPLSPHMEKTGENVARYLTWFKDSLRARSDVVEERQNKAAARGPVLFCALKSPAAGRTVSAND